jgi:hypothetical protein
MTPIITYVNLEYLDLLAVVNYSPPYGATRCLAEMVAVELGHWRRCGGPVHGSFISH